MRLLHGLIAACSLLLAHAAPAQNIITNGSFDTDSDGWGNPGMGVPQGVSFDWQKDGGRAGGAVIHIRADDTVTEHGPWIWSQSIDTLPKAKAFKLSLWVRGKGVSDLAAVCIQAWAADSDDMNGFATTQTKHPLKGDFDWTHVEAVLVPKNGAGKLIVMAFVAGKGEAWFDDIALEPTDAPTPAAADAAAPAGPARNIHDTSMAGQPGLFMARGGQELTATRNGAHPRFMFPLPLNYREQTPLSFRIASIPDGKLENVKVRPDTTGGVILEGEVEPMASGETVEVRWESLVLVGPRSFEGVPKGAAIPTAWPEEAKPWLAATWCADTDDKRIRAIGARVRGDGQDVLAAIDRACEEARQIYSAEKGMSSSLTAVQALDHTGSCTSCANLVAALLRSAGIPARILSGYPVWSGPLQTHYIVEAYIPDYGWYPIESTMLENPWPPFGQIAVRIIPTDDEDQTAESRFPNASGVPYLSLTEFVGPAGAFTARGTIDRKNYCDHEAVLIRPYAGTPDEWAAATRRASARWGRWLAQAIQKGGTVELKPPPDADVAQGPAGLLQ